MEAQPEQILNAILDYTPENIVLMDCNYKVICFNQRIRKTLFLYHNRYIQRGDDYRDFVIEATMGHFLAAFDLALKGKITEVELETVGDNFSVWFDYRVNPVYTPDGKLLGVSLSAEDITDSKRAQQKLELSEEKFRTLIEQSQVGVFILSNGFFTYVNPTFEAILKFSASEAENQQLVDFLHDDDVEMVRESCRQITDEEQRVVQLTPSAIRSDGAVRSWEMSLSRIAYRDQWAILGSVLDITERLDAEIRTNEAVDRAQERQRTEIGMELHDNVKQQLVSTMFLLQLYQETNKESESDGSKVLKCIGYLQQSIDDLRKLSHRLAPAVDEETGIVEKVNDLVVQMNLRKKLEVSLSVDNECGLLNKQLQLVIYRIIQEQFSNIINYADARSVDIRIYKESGNVVVSISDDGNGTDTTKNTLGIGLANIRRRVQVLGGSVRILTSVGRRFTLTATIPI